LRVLLSHVYAWPEVRRGGERYLHELASALQRSDHDVTILSTSEGPERRGIQLGVPVHYLQRRRIAPRRFGELSDEIAFGIESLLRMGGRKADVWHALGTADAAAASLVGRMRPTRSVFTDLGLPAQWWRDQRPDRRIFGYVASHVDRYICLSDVAAQALANDYGREASVIGGGVDLARFAPRASRCARPAVLYSGSLTEPRKRIGLLLDAAEILLKDIPSLQVWLSGPGSVERLLRGRSARLRGAVVDLGLGSPEEQAHHYARAWVTVLPSMNEAFGLALLESLACGTPIVATEDAGGPRDLIEAETGVLVQPTPRTLSEGIREALGLAADPLTVDACRTAARRHDWLTGVVPRMERLYSEVQP
jgi:glycosyltransferase involved in cell wall biosynthesis